MAAAAASRDLKKELCSVCCETYDDPRQLPCIHSYCLKCIREYCKDKNPGDTVACPLCREVFNIPTKGVAGLPKNFFLEQLKELAGPSNIHCDVCSRSVGKAAMKKVVTELCVDCGAKLCETCAEIHGQMRPTMGHHLVAQDEDEEPSESKVRLTKVYCIKHKGKVLELFCCDCKTAICMMCFVQSHQTHKCSEIHEVAGELRGQMTGDIKKMDDTVNRCREIVEVERKKKVEFNNKVKELEREICDRADRLKQLIDEDKSNLLKELKSVEVERNEQVDNVVEELEQHILFVESLGSYTEQLRDKGRFSEVTQQKHNVHDRADELLKLDAIQRAINELGCVDVTFTAATWPTSKQDIVGKISKKRDADTSSTKVAGGTSSSTAEKRPQQMIPGCATRNCARATTDSIKSSSFTSLTHVDQRVSTSSQARDSQRSTANHTAETSLSHVISANGRRAVAGITVCCEKLFVLRVESEEKIEQFDVNTFKELDSIEVKRLRDNCGWWGKSLTSCDVNKCLYVVDCFKVFRVDLTTNNVIAWLADGRPRGLSVNRTNHLLVTCWGDNSIKEYSSRGSYVKLIELQANHVKYPLHCVQLTDGHYVVSHVSPVNGVSEIDEHGTLVATYRNRKTTKLKMNWPRCVLVVNKSILVADMLNDRILVMNTSLSDARLLYLPINSQLSRPRCMYLEQSSGRLFVGEESGRVLVFDQRLDQL